MSAAARLQRVRFADGQRLRADDLTDALGGELARQRLHVVAAHHTWGIADGLEVTASARGATVAPGAAFDRAGRALVLRCRARMLAPKASGSFVLVLAHGEDGATTRFATTADVRPGLDVPLAAFAATAGALGDPDLGVRQVVRPLAGAHVGAGSATLTVDPAASDPIVRAFVDTSTAGFSSRPAYVITRMAGAARDAFVWIDDPGPDGFTACVWARGGTGPEDIDIDWLGAEPPPGCPRPAAIKELT